MDERVPPERTQRKRVRESKVALSDAKKAYHVISIVSAFCLILNFMIFYEVNSDE